MSLINDALKRARQAQQENPPVAPELEFRPVEPGQQPPRRPALLFVGLTLVSVAILGLSSLLVYFVVQTKPASLQVAARVADRPVARLSQAPTDSNPPAEPPATNFPAEPTLATLAADLAELPDEPNTNGLPVVAAIVEALQPAPLKLQGIFFNPRRPAAVVAGRTVYLGDRVGGFRVMGISPVAVTLVNAAETNVLSLSGQ